MPKRVRVEAQVLVVLRSAVSTENRLWLASVKHSDYVVSAYSPHRKVPRRIQHSAVTPFDKISDWHEEHEIIWENRRSVGKPRRFQLRQFGVHGGANIVLDIAHAQVSIAPNGLLDLLFSFAVAHF